MRQKRILPAAVLMAGFGAVALAADAMPSAVMLHNGVFTDRNDLTLYISNGDRLPNVSACYDNCAHNWPPFLAADGAADAGDWKVMLRDDGTRQWSYKGKPLYYFLLDTVGETKGDGVGNVWHAASPSTAAPATAPPARPAPATSAAATDFYIPDGGWAAANVDLLPPAYGPGPVGPDPAHPYIANGGGLQSNFRVGDAGSPILQPWAAAEMMKSNAEVLAGGIGLTARSSCRPAGVPGWEHFIIEPIYFIQSPKEILLFFSGDQQVRHIYMNVPHSRNPKPSWYGESVGHFEGDTLVVDTIGFNAKAYIDNYRTPHTDKLHVVERFHKLNGKGLQVDINVDDPDTFTASWSAIQRYRPVPIPYDEQVCIEGNLNLFDYQVPIADKLDF